jgi:hypothetical protein
MCESVSGDFVEEVGEIFESLHEAVIEVLIAPEVHVDINDAGSIIGILNE